MTARGLTLIETLGAVAILAVMGMISASLIRSARQSLEAPAPSVHIAELESLADALLEHPEALQIDSSRLQPSGNDTFDVNWLNQAGEGAREPARAHVFISDETDHAWLTLQWRGVAVSRWLPRPREEQP